jgi:hypothetical protein
LGSFAANGDFEPPVWAPWRTGGASRGRSPALQQPERAMKSAVGRRLVADEGHELAKLWQRRAAVEERSLRPRRAPTPPGRVHDRLGEHLLEATPRRERGLQLRPKPLEILRVLVEHHHGPRGEPVTQRIPARGRLAHGRPGPGAPQGVAAVGGDLGGAGHGFPDPTLAIRTSD